MTGALFDALEATWPPVSSRRIGPFRLREGAGGGKRVSAAVLDGAFTEAALDAVEAAGATLFQIRSGEDALDAALDARGYRTVNPSVLYVAPVETVAQKPRPVSLLAAWPPLAIQRALWAEAGVGPERIAVMMRACDPKQGFVARFQNRAAGVGFVAVSGGIAMMHALHVDPAFRRHGVARYMVRGMALWAQEHGARSFALAVTQGNAPARALYSGLGMVEAATYHYREKQP